MKVSWTNVLVGIVLLAVGAIFGPRDEVVDYVTRVDTVAPAQFYSAISELAISNEGLRARLEGREARRPSVVVRTDTVVTPPDTVYDALRVTAAGTLTISNLIRTAPDSARPELHQGIDIRDCDEGVYVSAGAVVCDKARLGHLYVLSYASIAADPFNVAVRPQARVRAGAYWEKSYRSPWRVSVTYGLDRRLEVGVSRGFKVF